MYVVKSDSSEGERIKGTERYGNIDNVVTKVFLEVIRVTLI